MTISSTLRAHCRFPARSSFPFWKPIPTYHMHQPVPMIIAHLVHSLYLPAFCLHILLSHRGTGFFFLDTQLYY